MKISSIIVFALLFGLNLNALANAQSSAVPVGTPIENASPASSPTEVLSADQKKNLLLEFKKAKSTVERALKHQERTQIKELQSAQNSQSKQWREKERKTRRAFFDAHMSGPERRQYVQDYLERKKAFDQSLKDAMSAKKKEWAQKNEDYKKRVAQQEADFKKSLDGGIRPAPELWPKE